MQNPTKLESEIQNILKDTASQIQSFKESCQIDVQMNYIHDAIEVCNYQTEVWSIDAQDSINNKLPSLKFDNAQRPVQSSPWIVMVTQNSLLILWESSKSIIKVNQEDVHLEN